MISYTDNQFLDAHRATRKSKGFALIQFEEVADAITAKEVLDESIFQGRLLHVLPAHRPPPQRSAAQTEARPQTDSLLRQQLA